MLHRRGRTNAETAPGTSERRFCVLLLLGRRLLLESPQQSDASQDHRARGQERQRAGLRHRHRGVRIPGIDEEDGEGHHRDQQPGAFSHWREPPCASYLSRVRVTFSDLCENSNNRALLQRSAKLAICALGPGVPSGTWKIPRQMALGPAIPTGSRVRGTRRHAAVKHKGRTVVPRPASTVMSGCASRP